MVHGKQLREEIISTVVSRTNFGRGWFDPGVSSRARVARSGKVIVGRIDLDYHRRERAETATQHRVPARGGQRAGFACQTPGVDDDSIDRTVVASGWIHQGSHLRSPKIDIQLKSIARGPLKAGEVSFVFRLNKKNYNDLRHRSMVPRLLVVLLLPEDCEQWIEQDDERLLCRYAAYYLSLSGKPEAVQRSKVPVELPRTNLLSVDNLRRLMVRASQKIRKLQ